MKHVVIVFSILSWTVLALMGCSSRDPLGLIRPSSYVEESVIPYHCETVKEKLRNGLPALDREVEELAPGPGECGRFLLPGGFPAGADAAITLASPNDNATSITVYQPYRSQGTIDLASRIMIMAERL